MLRMLCLSLLLGLVAPVMADTLTVGQPAPVFALKDQSGVMRSLEQFRGKWLVLYFYPKNDTPGCTTEACNFRDGQAFITGLGAQVVGVSIDESASHKAFAEKYKLPFPLLADAEGTVADRYGALSNWGVVRFAKRQTFIIDPRGVLRKIYRDVDADKHAQQVLDDLKALTTRG
ncbi:peroxiredoxin [Viridibacterium curvum]|uniref:thioredoxin-dependent peroxiredoxin n=1 Tax=Viridibacterium curvum TaxID=1101404 RepID=A0ABP9QBJ0_9RHOO